MIDDELLKILICPACKSSVRLEGEKIICTKCGRRYPIRNGIPVMLIDEAEGGDEKRMTKESGAERSLPEGYE